MYFYCYVENFDCLCIDLIKEDKSIGIVIGRYVKKEFSFLYKLEVVIIEGMVEKMFNMEMKFVMCKFGYLGFLENVRYGKGIVFFIRNDKLKKKKLLLVIVFVFILCYFLV